MSSRRGGPSKDSGVNINQQPSSKNQEVLDQIKQLSQAIHSAKQNQTARPPLLPSHQGFGQRGGRGRGRPGTRYQPYAQRPPPAMVSRRPPASTLSKNQTLVVKPTSDASLTSNVHSVESKEEEDKKEVSYVSQGNILTRLGARKFPFHFYEDSTIIRLLASHSNPWLAVQPPKFKSRVKQPTRPRPGTSKSNSTKSNASKNRSLFVKDGVSYSRSGNKITSTSVLLERKEKKDIKRALRMEKYDSIMPKRLFVRGVEFVWKGLGLQLERAQKGPAGHHSEPNIPSIVHAGPLRFRRNKKGNLVLMRKNVLEM